MILTTGRVETELAVIAELAENAGEIGLPALLDEAAALIAEERTAGIGDSSFNQAYNRVLDAVLSAINPEKPDDGTDPAEPDTPDELEAMVKDAYAMTHAKLRLVQAACRRKMAAVTKRLAAMREAAQEAKTQKEQAQPMPPQPGLDPGMGMDPGMPGMQGMQPESSQSAAAQHVYKHPEELAADIAYIRAVGDSVVF